MNLRHLALLLILPWLIATASATPNEAELQSPSISGGVADGKVRLIIEGLLNGSPADKDKLIFSTALQQSIKATREKVTHHLTLTLDILQGDPKELPLTISGEGEIKQVTGEALQDWSIRQETGGTRLLILRPKKGDKPLTQLTVTILAERELKGWKNPLSSLVLTPPQPALFSGFVKVESAPELDIQADAPTGLLPVEAKYLPEALRAAAKPDEPEPLAFQFHGSAYALPLRITNADPETRQVVLRDFKLTGRLADQNLAFILTATAHVTNPKGGSLNVLSGGLALTELPPHSDFRIVSKGDGFVLLFDKPGDFPLSFQFNAAVRQDGVWNTVDFRVAPGVLLPIVLQGLAADTQFQFAGAARPERTGAEFTSFLPPDGTVKLAWKSAAPEAEGKLFYAAEMLSQISVGPGLMRQVALLDCKVMQGELDRVTLLLRGAGEVTRVQGEQVLAWTVEPGANDADRRLVVQFNQPQKNQFALQVQTQTPIGAFPQTVDAMQLRPEGATRFAGYFRIVNEGAVRLEVAQARGLSQVSPEQFPESDATRAAFRDGGEQRFAYRFSGADFALRLQADQILPELTVSEVLAYHHGENELSIEAEIELDVREAPLRELLLRVPRGYAVAKLNVANLSDYFLRDLEDPAESELRLVFAQPVSGRQVVQLRLERNQALGAADWTLPRLEVIKAKSVRGHIAVSADAGFRLTAARTQALTEIATAFFPRKISGIQTAFRLSEENWQATMHVERLPQSIQADAFHLFSIGEGIAYGSSVLNYVISGAPVEAFKVELSDEYFNVEFTGKDIRNWQKTDGGFVVQLHTPVSGTYTLLATYERPFKAQGETLTFTGARPVDAQSEQGHTLVISAYQFQVKPVDVSPGLLPLEPGEVPPEYRLFFDAPILAAYRYVARPFDLKLALSPLAQGDSLSQVVDRAALATRISKEGQVLTEAHYFVKNRGNAHFAVTLPAGAELWSAAVNGAAVVPVKDGKANLIPLPQQADPNAVLAIDLKFAARSNDPERLKIATPIVAAPVMLAEWKLEPDTAQRLIYRDGSVTPVDGIPDVSGFAVLGRILAGDDAPRAAGLIVAALGLLVLAVVVWRGAARDGVYKFTLRHWSGTLLGCVAFALAGVAFLSLAEIAGQYTVELPRDLTFLAPVQQAGSAMAVEIGNVEDKTPVLSLVGLAWPVLLALLAWMYARLARKPWLSIIGWTLLAWAALRLPNGAGAFLAVLAVFFVWRLAVPALRRLWQLPRQPGFAIPPTAGGAAAATAAVLIALFIHTAAAQEAAAFLPKEPPVAETVTQQIRVEESYASATAKIRWQAVKGQRLPLLFEPAVLTRATYPAASLKLVQAPAGGHRAQQLLALESGAFDIEAQYQVPVSRKDDESGFALPAQFGLVNQLTLTLAGLDVDVVSPQAVSIVRKSVGKDTIATLVLAPANDVWIGWKPRSRDVAGEKAVFYAELTQLYAPTAGVIEGLHHAAIRPAQGELGELSFAVPKGATITDVLDAATLVPAKDGEAPASVVSQWRFDPDTGQLRVNLTPPQSRPFGLLIRSQIATGPLPVTSSVGLISVENAAGQIGLLGLATGTEVQLDTVTATTLAPINLEDFPPGIAPLVAAQIPASPSAAPFVTPTAKRRPNCKRRPWNRTCVSSRRTRFRSAKIARCSRSMPPSRSRAPAFSG